jgi:hypothetical protein
MLLVVGPLLIGTMLVYVSTRPLPADEGVNVGEAVLVLCLLVSLALSLIALLVEGVRGVRARRSRRRTRAAAARLRARSTDERHDPQMPPHVSPHEPLDVAQGRAPAITAIASRRNIVKWYWRAAWRACPSNGLY